MAKGIAYFKDGHEEPIIDIAEHEKDAVVIFRTTSGLYRYMEWIEEEDSLSAFHITGYSLSRKQHAFYKHLPGHAYSYWMVTDIEKIEIMEDGNVKPSSSYTSEN